MSRWLLLQLLLVLLATAALPKSSGQMSGGSKFSNVWAAVNLSDCNATCARDKTAAATADGVQVVKFACYAAGSDTLRRLPGTRFFLATSEGGRLADSSCAGIEPPALALVRCRREPNSGSNCPQPHHSWQLDTAVTAASPLRCQTAAGAAGDATERECGRGGQVRLGLVCRRGKSPASLETVEDFFCLADGLPKPTEPLSVPCRQTSSCRPVWKAGEWSVCSRDCGLGEIARTVECSQLTDGPEGPVFKPAVDRCAETEARPHGREFCVLRPECPPYFRLRPGKCLPTFSTTGGARRWCNETGLSSTNAECAQLVGEVAAVLNQTVQRPSTVCRDLPRPPLFLPCRVDSETIKLRGIDCIEPDDAKALAPPQLLSDPAGSLLVQMERLPLMDARCGQEVTLIPGTRLRLHCDVANFKADELRWRKLGREKEFQTEESRKAKGKACGRICISHGDLVFAKFKPRDAGTYEVMAGKAKSRVHLTWHTAYEAYLRAYLPRAHLLRRGGSASLSSAAGAPWVGGGGGGGGGGSGTELVRDAPGRVGADTLSWTVGPWSTCRCGLAPDGRPQRHKRAIRCERLRAGVYAVVEQRLCERFLGPPPATEEECEASGGRDCPTWRIEDWDGECPGTRCYMNGTSLSLRRVTCHVVTRNLTLPDSDCLLTGLLKPETARQCPNPACEPEWMSSPWSACSVSCGGFGFRSRQIRCLWRGTGRPAGLACEGLALPRGFKSCYEGPCHLLGCVDLLSACKIYQASALCAHPSLRKSCCLTCNAYDLKVYEGLRRKRV